MEFVYSLEAGEYTLLFYFDKGRDMIPDKKKIVKSLHIELKILYIELIID
jgi:hypothetical protein